MDHWHPEMFENTQAAYPNKSNNYHLSTDLVDKSIDYLKLESDPENINVFDLFSRLDPKYVIDNFYHHDLF